MMPATAACERKDKGVVQQLTGAVDTIWSVEGDFHGCEFRGTITTTRLRAFECSLSSDGVLSKKIFEDAYGGPE